jgi:multicomponent Na+:H+ antiporter subunit D
MSTIILWILLPLLISALILPLLKKHVVLVKVIFMASILLSTIFSWWIVMNGADIVNTSVVFGSWDVSIGIEFKFTWLAMVFSAFVMSAASLVSLYALSDMSHHIEEKRFASYATLVLLMLFAINGITFTNDIFNMYVFMEILSITSAAIISIKHSKANYLASFRYLMLNSIGSISILMAIAFLYMVSGQLNMDALAIALNQAYIDYPTVIAMAMIFMLVGFGIKAAMFPLHVWLPDAHSNAPSPSSALLSGVVVKVYIILVIRMMHLVYRFSWFEALNLNSTLSIFALLGILAGSLFAMGQKDIKRLLAYSSIAQIGYLFLGISLGTSAGLSATLFHIMTHGVLKIGLFLSVGAFIYQTHKRRIIDLEGIGYEMPLTLTVFGFSALGLIGIPGTMGFMSKFYLSTALINSTIPLALIIVILSSFLNAVYYMPIIINGFLKNNHRQDKDFSIDKLPITMKISLISLLVINVSIGLFPNFLKDVIDMAVNTMMRGGL